MPTIALELIPLFRAPEFELKVRFRAQLVLDPAAQLLENRSHFRDLVLAPLFYATLDARGPFTDTSVERRPQRRSQAWVQFSQSHPHRLRHGAVRRGRKDLTK